MGKVYTFIHKGQVNSKVRTELLPQYLDNGWEIGNWNQSELNSKTGAAVKAVFDSMREDGSWDEWNKARGNNVSNSLHKFWVEVADEVYIADREVKKAETRAKWTEEERAQYSKKMSDAAKLDRAIISSEEYHRRSIKATETKKKNGTFSTSSYENIAYSLLCSVYGEDDIVYDGFIDDRYTTRCDFYIRSLDIFIELNIHPSHGKHPFNKNSESDMQLMRSLQEKGDDWSNMILDVWCNRDVNKFEQAKNNKLNYIAVYGDMFDDFITSIKENNIWSLVNLI